MALNEGLFRSQDQNEQDLSQGPGWTIDQQKPGAWEGFGFGVPPVLRGLGQSAADGVSLLAHGFSHDVLPDMTHGSILGNIFEQNPISAVREVKDIQPTLDNASKAAHDYSKSLTGDPRTTGSAANLVQGFSKAVGTFSAGTLAGGPEVGATLLGASEGYAHYRDLLDQGVDPETAKTSALLHGAAAGAGAVLPMALPARLLSGLSTTGALLAQAGVGAAVNTSFGVASTMAESKILRDAGYLAMADQMDPWDKLNLATAAITGLFFGAHAGYHGMKGITAADVDPAVRDAAKVVQDRQEIIDRAPGAPVDMPSMAIHRQALEESLERLLKDEPVTLDGDRVEGAKFARPEEDIAAERAIMREEFIKSGVLDDAEAFDRWARGEEPPKQETPAPKPEVIEGAEPPQKLPTKEETPEEEQAQRSEEPATTALASRPDLQIPDENGEPISAADEHAKAIEQETQANAEAEPMHQAAAACEARHA